MRRDDNLSPSCAVVTKSENLNFLEPCGPVTGLIYLLPCHTLMKLEFSGRILENTPMSYFMKIRPVGAELFHADGRTDMTKLSPFEVFLNSPKYDRVFRSQ